MADSFVLQRIDDIETEVEELKKNISSAEPVQLKGIWDGASIDEEDIEKAKASLFEEAG